MPLATGLRTGGKLTLLTMGTGFSVSILAFYVLSTFNCHFVFFLFFSTEKE
jgi:hypothetical protein